MNLGAAPSQNIDISSLVQFFETDDLIGHIFLIVRLQ